MSFADLGEVVVNILPLTDDESVCLHGRRQVSVRCGYGEEWKGNDNVKRHTPS